MFYRPFMLHRLQKPSRLLRRLLWEVGQERRGRTDAVQLHQRQRGHRRGEKKMSHFFVFGRLQAMFFFIHHLYL